MAKRMLAAFICFIIAAALTFSAAAESADGIAPSGYTHIASSGSLTLYADMKSGDFAVYDSESARTWYSGQQEVLDSENPISQLNSGRVKTELVSMLALNYVQMSTIASTAVPLYQNSYAYCVNEGNVTVRSVKNGYRADYYFADLDITVPIEVTLDENALNVRIIGEELKAGNDYLITSVALLPGFMAGDDRYQGYLFVPSGSGGTIPFASGKGEIAEYSEMVYGDDLAIEQEEYEGESKNIHVPVYGIKSGNTAITAIIVSGDSSARITAQADSLSSSFTRVYSEYVTSIIDSTTLFESNYENQRIIYGAEKREEYFDYEVRFEFLNGDSADYSGIAQTYREYLDLKSTALKPSLKLTLYGAAEKKASFLGIPYKKSIALTSFKQAREITETLRESGVDTALRYIGWNNSGINNKKVASKFAPVSVLGGKSGFKELYGYLEKSGDPFYFDLDLMLLQKSGNGFSVFSDVCKSIFNTRTPIYEYMRSVFVPVNNRDPHYLLTPSNVKEAADKFLKQYNYGGGLSFSQMGGAVYSDFKTGGERFECIEFFEDILKETSDKHTVALDAPNAYAFKYTDTIYNIPMSNDGNLLFDSSVPFLQMVLHGSVSYGAESGCDLLDCIEYGADPSVCGIYCSADGLIETDYNWLYDSSFENWRDEAAEIFNEYNEVYKNLYDRKIVRHSSKDGVSETEFDNGTVIFTNRTDKAAERDGVTVPAGGCKVIGGGNK